MLHRSGPKIEIRPTKNHDPTRDPQNLPILFLISASSSLLKGWDGPVVKNIPYTFVQKLTGLSGGGGRGLPPLKILYWTSNCANACLVTAGCIDYR